MNPRNALLALVSLGVVGVLGACGNTATGTPVPQSGATVSSETAPTDGDETVPPIENPKDLAGIDPCTLLTQEQVAEFGITGAASKEKSLWGEDKCLWQTTSESVGLSPDTTQGVGLERDYQNRDSFDNFEKSQVDDYPAAQVNFASELCSIIVGVADDQTLTVHFERGLSSAPGEGDPCGFAKSVASTILKNLPSA